MFLFYYLPINSVEGGREGEWRGRKKEQGSGTRGWMKVRKGEEGREGRRKRRDSERGTIKLSHQSVFPLKEREERRE